MEHKNWIVSTICKLQKGNVCTSVCQEFCPQGGGWGGRGGGMHGWDMYGRGHVWLGAYMAGGMHGRGCVWQGGMHGGGCAWQEIQPLQLMVRILLECILVTYEILLI